MEKKNNKPTPDENPSETPNSDGKQSEEQPKDMCYARFTHNCGIQFTRLLEKSNPHAKGICLFEPTNILENYTRPIAMIYKFNARDNGIVFQFCPICGERIFFEITEEEWKEELRLWKETEQARQKAKSEQIFNAIENAYDENKEQIEQVINSK